MLRTIWPKHDKIKIATTAGNTRNWPKLLLHPKAEEKRGTRGWGWVVKKGVCSLNNKIFTFRGGVFTSDGFITERVTFLQKDVHRSYISAFFTETYSFSVSQTFQTYLH